MLEFKVDKKTYTLDDIEAQYHKGTEQLAELGLHSFLIGIAALSVSDALGATIAWLGLIYLFIYTSNKLKTTRQTFKYIQTKGTSVEQYCLNLWERENKIDQTSLKYHIQNNYAGLIGWFFLGCVLLYLALCKTLSNI